MRGDDATAAVCVRRAALSRRRVGAWMIAPENPSPQWFVTVTVGGRNVDHQQVRESLARLAEIEPFLVSSRYSGSRIEFCYWDESEDMQYVAAQAARLWAEHGPAVGPAGWRILGLDVTDRLSARRRWQQGDRPPVRVLGEIVPLDD